VQLSAPGRSRSSPSPATTSRSSPAQRGGYQIPVDWAGAGIRVNGVAPGYVETDLTAGMRDHKSLSASVFAGIPMSRFGRPDEVAALVSDESSYITGQTFAIDGGLTA
jgi:NAD(P)-dependent dehydrogenase (short-subunit alcohol dehydrogenase family)